MNKSVFHISKMDCPSEEQMIRMKLDGNAAIKQLSFDIPNRKLEVYHSGEVKPIEDAISELQLQSTLVSTEDERDFQVAGSDNNQKSLLIKVLLINAGLFVVEIVTGFISHSMGLVADSLDMLADAIVYALSLYAVGSTEFRKKKIAKVSGYFQFALAIFGFLEVIRRFMGFGEVPEFRMMIFISVLALTGNLVSLILLQRSKSEEAHMKASMIFTSNDVIANIGVIAAGGLVYFTASKVPDLVVGSAVFFLVARGAIRILKLSK